MGSFEEDFCVYPGKRGEVGKLLLWGPRGTKKFSKGERGAFLAQSSEISARCYSGRRMSPEIHPTSCLKQCKRAAVHALARHRPS